MITRPIDADIYAVIFNRVPRLCVDLLLRDRRGRILLAQRSIDPWRGRWHMPGGGLRMKETIAQAARRIARHELGVGVRPIAAIGICEILRDDKDGAARHSVSIVMRGEIVSGRPRPRAESTAIRYFALLPRTIHPEHGRFLQRIGPDAPM